MNTIPIQELVDQTMALERKALRAFFMAKIIAITGPLSGIFSFILGRVIDKFVEWGVEWQWKVKFRANMDVITSSQGADFRQSVADLIRAKADPNLTNDEWERKERAANDKLHQLSNLAK